MIFKKAKDDQEWQKKKQQILTNKKLGPSENDW